MASRRVRRNRRDVVRFAGGAVAIPLAGCVDAPGNGADAESTGADDSKSDGDSDDTMATDRPNRRTLHDPLPGLLEAADVEAYAAEHGLTIRDGAVKVTIELESDGEVPEALLESVETEYAGRVGAFVPIDRLEELAAHEDVRAVRPPADAEPQERT